MGCGKVVDNKNLHQARLLRSPAESSQLTTPASCSRRQHLSVRHVTAGYTRPDAANRHPHDCHRTSAQPCPPAAWLPRATCTLTCAALHAVARHTRHTSAACCQGATRRAHDSNILNRKNRFASAIRNVTAPRTHRRSPDRSDATMPTCGDGVISVSRAAACQRGKTTR